MSDNSDGRHATRILRTHDLVSGEELLFVYFPKVGAVTVNGYSVTRSRGLEGWTGQSVFHRALGNKKFTVATDSITKLYI